MPETLIWKILLVDDDEDDYLLTREMLAIAQGKEVQLTWASSFAAGCQALESDDFDAVLIDYDLGEHSGIELIRLAVAQDYPNPLMLITGRGGYEVDLEAMQAGATLYLTKSELNPPLLDRSIRYAIERKQADKALRQAHQQLEWRVQERTRELAQANLELEEARLNLETTVAERTAELSEANDKLADQMVELEAALNESQEKEERISRLTRFYLTLSQVNEAIVRTRDPAALFSQVCSIVAEGGFPLVWIGEVEGVEVVPVASCGPATGYLNGLKIEIQGELGNGPTGRCIREDHPVVNDDFATNPSTRPWRAAALRFGIRASAAFPLHRQGKAIGAFTLYAREPGTFDPELVSLLVQLGDDISYALDALDQELLRTQAEEALRTSEERYRLISENAADVIWTADPVTQRFTYMSPSVQKLRGYTAEEVVGQPIQSALTPESYKMVAADMADRIPRLLSGDESARVAVRRVEQPCKDGSTVPSEVVTTFLTDEQGKVTQILGVTRNLRDRVKSEEARRASEERYRSLFNSMEEGFCIIEVIFDEHDRPVDYRFLEINAAFENQTGLHDAQGKLMRTLAPEHEEHWFQIYGQIVLTGEPAHFENEARALNRYYDVYAYRVGRPEDRQVAVVFTDISERRRTEEALRQSEAMLRAVVDQMPSGVTVRDARTGGLVLSNARAQEILGNLVGSPDHFDQYQGIHPDGTPYSADEWPLTRTLATGEAVNAEEVECQRSDGARITLQIGSAPVRDPQGKIVAAVSIFDDITERIQIQEKLRQSEQRYRGLFESMQEGFYMLRVLRDEAGRPCDMLYLDANPAFERIMGRPRDQIIGHTGKELAPLLKQGWLDAFSQVEQSGEPSHYTSYSDTFQKHFETFIFRPAEGQVAVLVNDITERQQSEEKLRQQSWLIEQSFEPIFTWDIEDGILSWNQGCEQIYGYTRADALGRVSHELLKTSPVPQETFIPELLEKGSWTGELRHTTKDGRQVIVESRQQLIEVGGRRLVLEANRDITARRHSEEALQRAHEREAWLARFPEENPNPVVRSSLDGLVLYHNPPAGRLKGWKCAAGQPVSGGLLPLIQQAVAQGREIDEDVELDGRFYSVSVIPLLEEGYVNIYGRDIARRRLVEQALELRSEELEAARIEAENEKRLLDAVMTALPVGVAITNAQGGNFFNNPAFVQVWGGMKRVDSVSDYAAFQAWWADSGLPLAPEEWASAQAVTRGEPVIGQVLEIQRFDGTHGFVINSASPVRDASGKIVGSAVSIQDITTLRQAEEALRESKQRWATTLASIGDAVVTTDENGVVVYLNPVAEKLSGWSSREAAGRPMEQVFPLVNEDTHQPAVNPAEKVLQNGQVTGLANHTALIDRSGQFIPIEDSAAPILDSAGQIVGVVMVFHDVTEKRKKENALREADTLMRDYAQKLERSNRELQDFASIASHDLQEPLRKIKAFSDMLQARLQGRLDEPELDLLERMCSASERMHDLIESLLMYARVTTKAQPFRTVHLRQLAEEALASFEVRIERSKGRVELGDLPQLEADPVQMRQLLQNLISNALKFHRPGVPPLVQVSGSTAVGGDGGAVVCIEVKDNGTGFDMKHLERIFLPFERLHGRSEYEGTGMGLAICKKIVERHQGTISARSVVGEGTTFTVTLPVKQG